MTTLHKEIQFESGICKYLAANGWYYAEGAIALLQERRTALISSAVTGKIDVRERVEVGTC